MNVCAIVRKRVGAGRCARQLLGLQLQFAAKTIAQVGQALGTSNEACAIWFACMGGQLQAVEEPTISI